MASFYSIIKYVNNSVSDEYIALGLVVMSGNKSYLRISETKLNFAYKLNPANKKLLEFTTEKLRDFYSSNDDSLQLFSTQEYMSTELLTRLSQYNNGILQFSKPTFIKIKFTEDLFDQYFQKFIGLDNPKVKNGNVKSNFQIKVEKRFYEPLRNRIDIDYTLRKKSLPSLYFDFHLDGIGVNGAMYAAKAIDFNSKKKVSTIQSEIAEFETVLQRLNQLADEKGIGGRHQYYLIADKRKDNVISYNELYSILKDPNMKSFKIVSSDEIDKVVRKISENNATKFSEILNEK